VALGALRCARDRRASAPTEVSTALRGTESLELDIVAPPALLVELRGSVARLTLRYSAINMAIAE
jgi:hypothetical protein